MFLLKALKNQFDKFPAYTAAYNGDVAELAELIQDKPSLMIMLNEEYHSPLYGATISSQLSAMALLLDKGANPLAQANQNLREIAATKGNESSLRLLTLYSPTIDEDISFWLKKNNLQAVHEQALEIRKSKRTYEYVINLNSESNPQLAGYNSFKLGQVFLALAKLEWCLRCKKIEEGSTIRTKQLSQLVYFYLGKAVTNFVKAANFYVKSPKDILDSLIKQSLTIANEAGDFCQLELKNKVLAEQFFAVVTLLEEGLNYPCLFDTSLQHELWIKEFHDFNDISNYANLNRSHTSASSELQKFLLQNNPLTESTPTLRLRASNHVYDEDTKLEEGKLPAKDKPFNISIC